MHLWDRYAHRVAISQQTNLRRASTANTSLVRLRDLGIPVEEQLNRINGCLQEIDQLLIPSTINNFINQRFVLLKEREIITIFEECDARYEPDVAERGSIDTPQDRAPSHMA